MDLIVFRQVIAILLRVIIAMEINKSHVYAEHTLFNRISLFSMDNTSNTQISEISNTQNLTFELASNFNVGFSQVFDTNYNNIMYSKTTESELQIDVTYEARDSLQAQGILFKSTFSEHAKPKISNIISTGVKNLTNSKIFIEPESKENKGLLSVLKWDYLYRFHPLNVLGEMTRSIIKNHFPDFACIGIVTEENADILNHVPKTVFRYHVHICNSSRIQETDTLDSSKLNNATLAFESLLIESLNAGCPLYIVQVLNPKAAVHCFARASRKAQYRLNRQYLFLPVLNNQVNLNEDIFSMKEMDYMPDVVIAKIVTKSVPRKTHEFVENSCHFTDKNCVSNHLRLDSNFKIEVKTHAFKGLEKPKVILIDVWSPGEGFLYSMDIFPDKTRNIEGKKLVLVTFYYPPFNIFNMNAKPPLYDGIEFRVAREYLRYVNASFRLTTDPTNYWGDVFENGTGNGVLGTVTMDKADLGFSAFYSWPSSFEVVDFSNTHMRSSVTILTPRPKLKPGYLMPIMPFSGAMWRAVGACYVGAISFLYLLQIVANKVLMLPNERKIPFSQLGYSALWLYAMLVSQGSDYRLDSRVSSHIPARHFIAWFLVMGEVICDSYSAGLAYVLSTPRYEPPIETIKDLSSRHVIWAGNHPAWIWSIEEDENPDLQAITRNFRVLTEEKMYEIGHMSGDMAFGIERLQGGHFTTEAHINVDTVIHRRIMKGTLYWSHLQFLLRKGSPYKKHFNTLVTRLREAGLPLYWEGEVIRLYMSERLQLAISTSRIMNNNENATKLNLDQLQGVFFILFIGYIIGIIIFIVELMLDRKHDRQKH